MTPKIFRRVNSLGFIISFRRSSRQKQRLNRHLVNNRCSSILIFHILLALQHNQYVKEHQDIHCTTVNMMFLTRTDDSCQSPINISHVFGISSSHRQLARMGSHALVRPGKRVACESGTYLSDRSEGLCQVQDFRSTLTSVRLAMGKL